MMMFKLKMMFDSENLGIGVFACCDGEEEEDADKMPRHGVVDEAAPTSVAAEEKGPTLRAPLLVSCWRRRRDGDHQGPARGAPPRHQTLPMP